VSLESRNKILLQNAAGIQIPGVPRRSEAVHVLSEASHAGGDFDACEAVVQFASCHQNEGFALSPDDPAGKVSSLASCKSSSLSR
jgi:hypothetical protein